MPICLVVLSPNARAKDIYELNQPFFVKISVQLYRNNGSAQCHNCQQFGHGSTNCRRKAKCVKCAGEHLTKSCTKTKDQEPTCCNCGGKHAASYRGCSSFAATAANFKPSPSTKQTQTLTNTLITNNPTVPTPKITTTNLSYASAVKGSPDNVASVTAESKYDSTKSNVNDKIITLLKELLTTITTNEDPKTLMMAILTSFLNILTIQ